MEDNVIFRIPLSLKCKIAKDEYSPIEILRILAKDKSTLVRSTVAQNPLLLDELDIFMDLSKDKEADVRRGLVLNPHIPSDILEKLAGEMDPRIDLVIANHPNSSPGILRNLYVKNLPGIREALAVNTSTPFDLLPVLMESAGDLGLAMIKERLKEGF